MHPGKVKSNRTTLEVIESFSKEIWMDLTSPVKIVAMKEVLLTFTRPVNFIEI